VRKWSDGSERSQLYRRENENERAAAAERRDETRLLSVLKYGKI
jgi:hypothetical protein